MTDTVSMRFAFLLVLICLLAMPAAASARTVDARTLVDSLVVATPSTMAGYSRDEYKHWTDADADGCSTRHEVLYRQNLVRPRPRCTAQTGLWRSVYDNKTVVRARSLDIDHMVPLAESWRSGAAAWNDGTRERFANDLDAPYSLIAVTATTNRSKGDKDPALWLPPNRSWRCTYVSRWVAVKWRWSLKIDAGEKARVLAIMNTCTRSKRMVAAPVRALIGLAAVDGVEDTGADDSVNPLPPDVGAGDDPRYATCAEAVAAGYGPYRKGIDPEYAWYRDGDSDGVVCEH